MGTLQLHLILGAALLTAAGCAQQPKRADYSAPPAVSATAPTAASAAASIRLASAFPTTLLVFAYDQGWRQVVITTNNHYFCRSDTPSGSLIPSPRCVSESQLEFMRSTVEQQRQQLTKPVPLDRAG
jgi:hypothetical protein